MKSTFRICASVLGLVFAMAAASLDSDAATSVPATKAISGAASPTPAACCMVCTQGKACGNSCIARYKDCHQPPGCACDG